MRSTGCHDDTRYCDHFAAAISKGRNGSIAQPSVGLFGAIESEDSQLFDQSHAYVEFHDEME